MTTSPKFKLRAWPNVPARIIDMEEAKELGFSLGQLTWLIRREVFATENSKRDRLSLHPPEDAIRDHAQEMHRIVTFFAQWYKENNYGPGPCASTQLSDEEGDTLAVCIEDVLSKIGAEQ